MKINNTLFFLQVAIINFQKYKFFILPPSIASESSPVNVAYEIDNTCSVDTHPRDYESGVPSTVDSFCFLFSVVNA